MGDGGVNDGNALYQRLDTQSFQVNAVMKASICMQGDPVSFIRAKVLFLRPMLQ